MDVCNNHDVLKVIYFILLIIDIIKIIIPIVLIIYGIIDFSKGVIANDGKASKKNVQLFFKRLLYAVLVFIVPWLIKVLMITLGNLLGDAETANFTDCIENATPEKIEYYENKYNNTKEGTNFCYICSKDGITEYIWGDEVVDYPGTCKKESGITNRGQCLVKNNKEGCYACGGSQGVRYMWGTYATGQQGGSCAFIDRYKDKNTCLEQNN